MERIEDHVSQAQSLLIEQYRGKPRLDALLASYVGRAQEIEDAAWDVIEARLVDRATGAQLRTLGVLVGQTWRGEGDEVLRRLIYARIRVNRSHGHAADIIAVTRLLLDGAAFTYSELAPAFVLLEVTGQWDSDLDAVRLVRMIREAKAAGVRVDLHYSDTDPDGVFTLSGGTTEVIDANKGLADDAGTTGGRLMAAL